jgi:hypothetical protein
MKLLPIFQNQSCMSIVLQYWQLGVTFGADMQPVDLAATFLSNLNLIFNRAHEPRTKNASPLVSIAIHNL